MNSPLGLMYRLAPLFEARTRSNPRFAFHTVHGAINALVFLGDLSRTGALEFLTELRSHSAKVFDDARARVFVVINEADAAHPLTQDLLPGVRFFIADSAQSLAQTWQILQSNVLTPHMFLLDRRSTVAGMQPLTHNGQAEAQLLAQLCVRLFNADAQLPLLDAAPVLTVPRVFEPELCKQLIAYYETHGGKESGVTRAREDGVTYTTLAHDFKRRQDCQIEDETLRNALIQRINNRLVPHVTKAFQFTATHIERHIVGRYAAEDQAFFRAHRDNTTKGTAHRRFAVTINLNASDYDGGDLSFPEFGSKTYRAPTGGAVVFSCSLLHQVSTVTRGVRYGYLPFLYTAQDAKVREDNKAFLDLGS